MPEPAERIQPEQDYADKVAEEWHGRPYERFTDLASLIRAMLRAEATEAVVLTHQYGRPMKPMHFHETENDADETWSVTQAEALNAAGYTVRRVLVLEVSDGE